MSDRIKQLEDSRAILWSALSEIIETRTANPNATVRRLIGIAETAIIDDPLSQIQPVPIFGKYAKDTK